MRNILIPPPFLGLEKKTQNPKSEEAYCIKQVVHVAPAVPVMFSHFAHHTEI